MTDRKMLLIDSRTGAKLQTLPEGANFVFPLVTVSSSYGMTLFGYFEDAGEWFAAYSTIGGDSGSRKMETMEAAIVEARRVADVFVSGMQRVLDDLKSRVPTVNAKIEVLNTPAPSEREASEGAS